ncbi:MAG: hypothetical protein KA515_00255 [Candidatus Pacebacteria bacterium]|nr:hypothetical protein [Candidatus Paceibacterota bacterium]
MSICFLPVESTLRELDYKINLARLFCAKGLRVIIGNPPFIRDELKYKNYRAIFLEKGLNPNPDYYKALSDKSIYLYDLADEGTSEPVYAINYEPTINALKVMRKVFLWGAEQRQDLMRRNSEKKLCEKYEVIGNPGFDLCSLKYKNFNRALKSTNLPTSYILINTNFGCFQSFSMEEHLEACTLISPISIQMMRDSYLKEEEQFKVFEVWLENIIQAFPNENFLVRPHPSEISENYKKLFEKYKNVMVSKEGNVNYVTASAKLVLHKDCSTALQSYLMGIPSISLGGDSLYKEYVQWPLNFSARPKNLDAAKEMIECVLKTEKFDHHLQSEIDKQAKNCLDKYFYNLGGSSNALVDIIVKDAEDLIKNKSLCKLIDTRTKIQKLKLFIRKKMPLHYKVAKAARETLVEFTKKDIVRRLDLLESIDPLGLSYHVKKIFPNTFEISIK